MTAAVHLSGTGLGASGGEIALSVAFALAFALFGYRISARFRSVRGVTPWRVPSIVWALICLVFQPFGIIVELFAEFTTRTAPEVVIAHPRGAPSASSPVPLAQRTLEPSRELDLAGPPVPRDLSGRVALFGWYADPTGRHERRYFDGRRWSSAVRDAVGHGEDPV